MILKAGGALLAFVAFGCAPIESTESSSTVAQTEQAVGTSQQALGAPRGAFAAATASALPPFSCQPSPESRKTAGKAAVVTKPADDQYRAPSTPKPTPDPRVAAPSTLVAAEVDPKEQEKQARYEQALVQLQKKHPQRGDAFEKERMELKLAIISGVGPAAGTQ